MELKFDDAGMKRAINEAILSQIDAPARDAMITEALAHIMSPATDYSGRSTGKSRLHEAFNASITATMREIVDKTLREDVGVQEKLTDLAKRALTMMFTDDDSNVLAKNLANAMAKSFVKEDYR